MKKVYERPYVEMMHVKVESLMLSPSKVVGTKYDGSSFESSHQVNGDIKEWEGEDASVLPSKRGNLSAWDWDMNWK